MMNAKTAADIFIDLVVAFVLSWVGYFIFSRILSGELAIAFAFSGTGILLAVVLPYSVAVCLGLVGLVSGRWGRIGGSLIFVVTVVLASSSREEIAKVALATKAEEIGRLDQRAFLSLAGEVDTISVDGRGTCESICRQILVQTPYAFATRRLGMAEDWTLFERVAGESCLTREYRRSYLSFLAAGYVGVCASAKSMDRAPDGLLIIANDNGHSLSWPVVGKDFHGHVFEAHERRGDSDRLLGRWIAGFIDYKANEYSSATRTKRADIGKPFKPSEFFSALLKRPFTDAPRQGPATTAELLTALRELDHDDETNAEATQLMHELVSQAQRNEQGALIDIVKSMLSDPRTDQKIDGLISLSTLHAENGFDFAKPHILNALNSGNADLISAALRSLYALKADERQFAEAEIVELAFQKVPLGSGIPVARSVFDYFQNRLQPFSADIQARASARLRSVEQLTEHEAALLLLLVGRKNEKPHEELFAFVMSLQGENFESAVKAIHEHQWRVIEGKDAIDWSSQELEKVLQRVKEVPDERFYSFVYPMTGYRSFDTVKDLLIDELDRRIKALKSDSIVNSKTIKSLQQLKDKVS